MEQIPLLQTKLYIPPIRSEFVPRPRLVERLNAGLDRKLTLISAPAGFGKTTLVSAWAQSLGQAAPPVAVAWLSLDEGDNDPSRFMAYVVAALRAAVSGQVTGPADSEGVEPVAREDEETPAHPRPGDRIGKEALSALRASQSPATEPILTSLLNDLATLGTPIVLVLDDYHLVEAQDIHSVLEFLLQRLPAQVHLLIATRDDPNLPLARLRAHGQLVELRAADLRFVPSEAARFLNQAMGLDLSPEDVAALDARTEGWIAGLQLAAISIQGRPDPSALIRSFTGSHRFVLDYLVEEVLDQQPDRVQAFLLRTAILDRLTASLCDAVTGQQDGQATLEALERANLFIVPLDNQRRWYRYHHLFADLLRQRSGQTQPEEMPRLHRRASEWYEGRDLPADAIHHALAAQDYKRAATLAELAWPAWSDGWRALTWLGWLVDLPDDLVRARPVLSLDYAWALLNAGRLEEAGAKLKDVEGWLHSLAGADGDVAAPPADMVVVDQEQFRALPASVASARAYHAQAVGDLQGTEEYVRRALELLPEDDQYNRASVAGLLGLTYWANGEVDAAYKTFAGGLFQNVHDQIKGTFVLAEMLLALGRLRDAESACEQGLQLARAFDPPMPLGTEDIYTALAGVHRQRGDLAAADQDLAAAKRLGDQVELPDWRHRWCIAQAQLKVSLGDLETALELLDEAERTFVRTPVPELWPIAALRAGVWIRQGRLAEALAWARGRDLSVHDDLAYLREFEHMTLARLRMAEYTANRAQGSAQGAMALLERLLAAAEGDRRWGSAICILVLQALALEAQDEVEAALHPLERALTLAEPEGFVQLFVDEGPPLARLLYEAATRGVAPGYARRLLPAFAPAEPEPMAPARPEGRGPGLLEPLSERELEVLQLIAQGLSNQEIADRLFLSLNTVKGHTRNIYGKLGVHSRTQAVVRARGFGILPAT